MSNLLEHAKKECEFMLNGDSMDEEMYSHIIHMVDEFAKEEHSGFSASYAVGALIKLLKFEPLRPLQGTDDEWTNVEGNMFQNKRYSRVFKNKDTGEVYDIEGKVFVEPDGTAFTSNDSKVNITFPYTPKTEYVYINELT